MITQKELEEYGTGETHMLLSSKWETLDKCTADCISAARLLFKVKGFKQDVWSYIVEIKTGQIERF